MMTAQAMTQDQGIGFSYSLTQYEDGYILTLKLVKHGQVADLLETMCESRSEIEDMIEAWSEPTKRMMML
jgi:hypothetical protein